jgi:type II secretory pathway pseudopilin PulG
VATRSRIHAEDGFSLAENIVTIAIVAIAFTALLSAMVVSITASSAHRKIATADVLARSAAEWVKDSVRSPYVPCAAPADYPLTGVSVPSGYSVSITPPIEYWDGVVPSSSPSPASGPYSPAFQAACQSPDTGLQRIRITATAADGETETVEIVKRVSP